MMKRTFADRTWHFGFVGLAIVGTALAACGGGNDSAPDERSNADAAAFADGPISIARSMLLVSTSDERGQVHVGSTDINAGIDLLLLDGKTQRPIHRARVEAAEQDDGYLVRVSRDEDAYEPEVVQVKRGARAVVSVNPATADVLGQAQALGVTIFNEDLLGEGDINLVLGFAKTENRPTLMFLPALGSEVTIGTQSFKVYKAAVPGALIAILADGTPAVANGTVVRSRARVVGMQGLAHAGVPLQGSHVQSAARQRPGAFVLAPVAKSLLVTPPDVNGVALLSWAADDTAGTLLGFDVGVDTTLPSKRVDKVVRNLPVTVKRGEHFACVRPVFDGSDVEPKLDCVTFDAPLAPPAPNVRVRVRALAANANTPVRARQPVAVEVEVENTGDVAASALDVAVVISRDGRVETGEGETRLLRVDGVPAKGRVRRVAAVIPDHDGAIFVAVQADPKALLSEANALDNGARLPLQVEPVGRNRAPVLSMTPASAGAVVKKGRPLPLNATAYDPEEGDISNRIVWTSTVDGFLGQGANPTAGSLSRGVHRVRATIKDQGVLMAPTPFDNERLPGKGYGFGLLWPLRQTPAWAAATDESEQVVGEFEIEVLDESLPVNSVPTVSAGSDLTTSVGVAVSPLAFASDADSDPLTIKWQGFVGINELALQDSTALTPKLTPTTVGVHRLVFEVSDGKSATTDEVLVNVVATNAPPTLQVALPTTAAAGMTVFATVTATDANADPLTLSYELGKPPGSAAVVQADGAMPSFVPDVAGLYTFVILADDGRGGRSQAQAQLFVNSAPMPDGGVIPDASVPVPDARPPAPDAPLAMNVGLGLSCRQSLECSSGFCVDGVCCSSACVGLCESCVAPGMQGTCTAAPVGQNPNGDCPAGSSCNELRQCGPFLVKPGSVAVAQGNVRLLGRGTWNATSDDRNQRGTCDAASGLCLLAVSPMGQSSYANIWVVSLNSPQSAPIVLAPLLNPGDDQTGFEAGVVLGTDGYGTAFAWKPGWSSPHYLSTGYVRDCRVSPNGLKVACFTNQRPDATGVEVDVAIGELASGGNLPAVVGIAHFDPQSSGRSIDMAFSPDSQKLL